MARIDARSGTHQAGEALEPYRRVLLNSSNLLMYADKDERCIGVTDGRCAINEWIAVQYLTKEGTVEVECGEAREKFVGGAAGEEFFLTRIEFAPHGVLFGGVAWAGDFVAHGDGGGELDGNAARIGAVGRGGFGVRGGNGGHGILGAEGWEWPRRERRAAFC